MSDWVEDTGLFAEMDVDLDDAFLSQPRHSAEGYAVGNPNVGDDNYNYAGIGGQGMNRPQPAMMGAERQFQQPKKKQQDEDAVPQKGARKCQIVGDVQLEHHVRGHIHKFNFQKVKTNEKSLDVIPSTTAAATAAVAKIDTVNPEDQHHLMSKSDGIHQNTQDSSKHSLGMVAESEQAGVAMTEIFVLKEVRGNLFKCPDSSSVAHCVSKDFKMSKGIALQFKRKFGCMDVLRKQNKGVGEVAILKNSKRYIYYMVTKKLFYQKPSYIDLENCLNAVKSHCIKNGVTDLSMPKIGCGLDLLNWDIVKNMLKSCFTGTNIVVTVYSI